MMSLVVVVKSEPTSALKGLQLQNLSHDYYRLQFIIFGVIEFVPGHFLLCVYIRKKGLDQIFFLSSLNLQLLLVE